MCKNNFLGMSCWYEVMRWTSVVCFVFILTTVYQKKTLCVFSMLLLNHEKFLVCLWIKGVDFMSLTMQVGWEKIQLFLQLEYHKELSGEIERYVWAPRPCTYLFMCTKESESTI